MSKLGPFYDVGFAIGTLQGLAIDKNEHEKASINRAIDGLESVYPLLQKLNVEFDDKSKPLGHLQYEDRT